MTKTLLLFAFLLCTSVNGQTHLELNDIKDVEIYFFEDLCLNKNSFYRLDKKQQQEFMSQYSSLKDLPIVYSPDYINSDLCKLRDTPFLNKLDIASFNWNTGKLVLTATGRNKLSKINFKYFGVPFTLKVKGASILNAWFWSIGSSQVCTRVYGQLIQDSKKITLKFDNSLFGWGSDPFQEESTIKKLLYLQQQ